MCISVYLVVYGIIGTGRASLFKKINQVLFCSVVKIILFR